MNITLKINNEEKIFSSGFVSTRKLKKALALTKDMDKITTNADAAFDILAEFILELYNNQFTIDELLDGYPANEFFKKAISDLEKIVGDFNSSLGN